ncbi:glycosyltransferase [Cellulomonas sp. P22]|uniref:glycosyltransferase n=1 Tax=Cellulomonas sp. P22 TaxID=3373189 RepID=UPI0037ABF84B
MRPTPLSGRPTVSVVVPCYNYGHFLPAAVASALEQPGVDVEVVVVDDASTDDSADVARALAAADDRVTVVVHERNARHIATYNDGLAHVTGDYVVLLSADDLLAPGSLSRATALLEAHPGVGLVYGYAPDFTDSPPPTDERVRSWSVWPGETWLRRTCRRGANVIVNPEVVMRTSVLRELGGYDPALPHTADMDLWMRAAVVADVGRVNGPVQAYYRVHGGNMHLNDYSGLLADMRERATGFTSFFAGAGAQLRDAERWHAAARRAIAYEAVRIARLSRGVDDPSSEALARFAIECSPEITSRPVWRAYELRTRGVATELRRRGAALSMDLRWRLRWRRLRRFGV